MICTPCRVTYQGTRYAISQDGTVRVIWIEGGINLPTGPTPKVRMYGEPVDPLIAKNVRREAARQRRNRNARERHQAMKNLGLKRVRGALGGVYYE